ncbi:MAG: pyruvate/2-oxoglutarate dehydrogenase complex dihydrolipoamide dehydrogenase (E3) component [Verrucomicrobiales bacterium]|jgi:pyruvate/2-oxoglutarate dehydrogenase complex dihydrolipoamide dehydrogenase (E3) component
MSHDLIIIGGGTAGLGAARAAATLGTKPLLITDGPVGGDCTFTGCVPSKTLISESRRGTSFVEAISYVHETIDTIAGTESADVLRGDGVDVVEGRGVIEAPGHVVVDGSSFSAKNIIIATGARPSIPPISGLGGVRYLTNESLFELTRLPKRLGVVGGGPIGCEMALAFAGFGSEVSIVEAATRLIPNEEPDASAVLERAMATASVELHLGSFVTSVSQVSDGIEVVVGDSSFTVDELLIATGRTANTESLDLEALGVKTDERGHIFVDGRLRSSVKGISAAGDVTGLLPFTHAAYEQARLATFHALKKGMRWKYDASSTPWVTFTSPEVARLGVTEGMAPAGAMVAHVPLDRVDRALTERRTDGFVKLIAGPKSLTRGLFGGEIIGATIVAERAGEMIHGPAMAARLGMFVGRLAQVTVAYPTWTTAVQQAAGMFFEPVNGLEARPARSN